MIASPESWGSHYVVACGSPEKLQAALRQMEADQRFRMGMYVKNNLVWLHSAKTASLKINHLSGYVVQRMPTAKAFAKWLNKHPAHQVLEVLNVGSEMWVIAYDRGIKSSPGKETYKK